MERPQSENAEPCRDDIRHVVVSRERIAQRVAELAEDITRCYEGREPTILAVMTGSLVFLADLIRRLPLRLRLHVIRACSYPGPATEPGPLQVDMPEHLQLAGRDVLIVDDVLDTGRTLAEILRCVERMKPASLRSCVLLDKCRQTENRPVADFCGFHIDGEFVVGYGLDIDDLYRNLPDICALTPEALDAVKQQARRRAEP